ncbi:M20 aminoacylase family protein [Niveibacterium umoris]|uniref:Hippurate hydrolase n=1 Tax=Niveibacterium umoris TaxID=1193620 RepID=A0A840BKY3_9RHOO|nr:M20 aminoacylase family protein [Niveibacterium umoris]MBB4011177.1 hippurate hydrolase [Niveibacterium umoris]
MRIIDDIRARHAELARIRRDIHAHPELAFDEHRTSELVARHLEALGIETHRGIGKTGVVGVIRAGTSQRAIGLRADMDALPITERNTFDHRSRHAGRMHACGHDGHTTMLLGAAEYLARNRKFDGTVVLIFQPAEEGEGGAPAMLADGLLDKFPFDMVFGMHNWPGLPVGTFGVFPGPVMASSDQWEIDIRGRGAHAAMPHQGLDPIVAGAALVQSLQHLITRTRDPLEPAVVSVTQFHAGEAYNAIPDRAALMGTVRALSHEERDRIEAAMGRVATGIATAHGVEVEYRYRRGYPPTINDVTATDICEKAAALTAGGAAVLSNLRPSMGAEDFAYFAQERPGCYVWIGNGPGKGGCTLHNPHYDFNDEALSIGASYWVNLVETALPCK